MSQVHLEHEGGVATLTIDNPKVNALNTAVLKALREKVRQIAADDAIRVVIVTGAGDKAFVAGADIGEMAGLGPQGAARFAQLGHDTFAELAALKPIVIAAVQGFCLGGGCELTLACDLVYAADNARFGQPEVKLGLIPGFGGTQRLARRVGPMRALDLVASGRMVDAAEAKAIGLVLDVFPADGLQDGVRKVAHEIANKAPLAVQAAKQVQVMGLEAPLATANDFERRAFALLFDSHDTKEGTKAFLEKRAPAFEGR